MADHTHIEWTDATWNPTTGCSVVSPGCTNCYAMRLAGTRLRDHPSRAGLTIGGKAGPVWSGQVRLNEDWLDQPLRWRRSRRIFVCAHGDLFHEAVPDEWIDKVFAVMALAPRHTFQVLTKRSGRMRAYMNDPNVAGRVGSQIETLTHSSVAKRFGVAANGIGPIPDGVGGKRYGGERWWPLPNVWLGVSAEDQIRAEERIPDLLATPAAVRFVSAEPLLGPISLRCMPWTSNRGYVDALTGQYDFPGVARRAFDPPAPGKLDWVIVGGESGPGARPCNVEWIRGIVEQCKAAGVPCFVKQVGAFVVDRNDRGFDAESEVFADGPNAGQPTDSQAWPNAWMDVEHNINGFREEYQGADCRVHLRDKKGGDMQEWPLDLRVRQFPAICRPCVESANG